MLKIVGTGVTALFLAALPFSFDGVTPTVSKAHARIGRPLTPLSVAGVHRRAMRRTYGVGANLGYHGYGYDNGYAAPVADLAPPAYGYAAPGYGYAAPGYGYAAPGYGYAAPIVAPGGTTVVIVTPGAPAYAAPYAVPPAVVSQPLFAPGYGYGYGYWNRGYWGGW
jgi:hypothetical protein